MSRQHLVEQFRVSDKIVKQLPLTEGKVLEEDGKSYTCRGAYEFPIWRLDQKNLNERVYSKRLAESLVKASKVTLGLTNHPKEDVDVNNTFCVERNPHIKEGILWVDAYLVGEKGQMVHEIIEAGGEVGLSSSAYGDVDDKGNVVEEGFEIERYADFVDTPSYEVFVKKENELKKEAVENTTTTSSTLNELIDNNSTNKVEEEKLVMTEKNEKKLSIEEKNLIMGVKNLMKEANSASTPKAKVAVYEQVIEYCDGESFASEYIQEAKTKISENNEKVLALAEKATAQESEVSSLKEEHETVKKDASTLKEELSEKTQTLEAVTEKYDVATDLLDNLKMREKKLREMYEVSLAEKNGMISASEYKELLIFSEELEETVKSLKESVIKYKRLARKAAVKDESAPVRKSRKVVREDDDEDEPIQEKAEKMVETETEIEDDNEYKFVVNNVDVHEYYEDLYENNPSVDKIKDQILKCHTIFEAQKTYLNLKDLVEDIPSPYRSTIRKKMEKVEEAPRRPSSFKLREGWD